MNPNCPWCEKNFFKMQIVSVSTVDGTSTTDVNMIACRSCHKVIGIGEDPNTALRLKAIENSLRAG